MLACIPLSLPTCPSQGHLLCPGGLLPFPCSPPGAGGKRGEEAQRSQRCVYRVIVMVTSLTKQMAPLNDGHPNSSGKCALISWLPVGSRVLATGKQETLPGSRAELRHRGTWCRSWLGKPPSPSQTPMDHPAALAAPPSLPDGEGPREGPGGTNATGC